jgi:hypothetical protein
VKQVPAAGKLVHELRQMGHFTPDPMDLVEASELLDRNPLRFAGGPEKGRPIRGKSGGIHVCLS